MTGLVPVVESFCLMPEIKKFYSKILLFGEYSIIRDSMGLAIPYPLFDGYLTFPYEKPGVSMVIDSEMRAFVLYLKDLLNSGEQDISLLGDFDIDSFDFDVSRGLYFCSTIPQGYGVGSSGALCAAVYDRYSKNKFSNGNISAIELSKLKRIFSLLESHFHRASSGIDPLISYLKRPILIKSMDDLQLIDLPDYTEEKGGIFLLNTGRARRTEPLVNLFLEKCNVESFSGLCQNVLLPITNGCIKSFLDMDQNSMYEFFRELSDFQYRHFSPMIPKLYRQIWREGLKSELFYLKLCGAGGGGFLLGITSDFLKAGKKLIKSEIRPLSFQR